MRRLLGLSGVLFALIAPSSPAAPRIVSTSVVGTPESGGTISVVVRAVDPDRPVSSVTVRAAGDPQPQFASSACGLTRTGAGLDTGAFTAGRTVALTAPAALASPGVQLLEVTVGSGGCDGTAQTTTTTLAVTVTLPVLTPRARGAAAAGCEDADLLPDGANDGALRRAIGCLLNAERTKRGLKPLRPNARLRRAAARHTRDMARGGFLSHTGSDGSTPLTRLRHVRYWPASVGENIGYGTGRLGTPRGLVDAWMRSAPHRENILRPGYRQIGIGVATNSPRTYSTTDFGRR